MTPFQNRAISASAGTGKTYRLAHRYLGLMAVGVEPERICALTFSKKAAGEIFDKIVDHLCAAATEGGKRVKTAETITKEGLTAPPDRPEAYIHLLRKLLNQEHRLRIGTLDSFILGIVRAFPMELGIPPETQPMNNDGAEAMALRQAILTRIFDPTRRPGTEGSREGSAFLDDFRLACFGQETKTLVNVLDKLIEKHYGFYRRHNLATWNWGDPNRIWQPAERWWDDPKLQAVAIPADLQARLSAAFGTGARPEKLAEECARIAEVAMAHATDKPWPDKRNVNEGILDKLLTVVKETEPPVVKYYNDYAIPPELWPPLRRALGNLIGVEVKRALQRSHGLGAILDRYDLLYTEALNTGGRFTFDDLSRLLGEDGISPSRNRDRADNRLYIDYRLDAQLDHWLLDEFQDTSDSQWAALANLIDEVVQDENRSFFYVGDVKQSIYGWRGGNHRLFSEVLETYRDMGPRAIVQESIAECHRSLPAVIAAVNAVFDDLAGWIPQQGAEKGPRPGAVRAFSDVWKRHESARIGDDAGEGFATLLEYVPKKKSGHTETADAENGDDAEGAGDSAEYEAVAQVLAQVQPTQRGLTAAVLVRGNKAGRACVDALRRRLPDVPVVHEGCGGIVDNPVVTLLLALVRYAAHPGNTVAMRHLQMSPLASQPEMSDLDALPRLFLAAIHEHGFADTLREWGKRLGELDPFGRQRLRELLAAAEQFDATGTRDCDAFAAHVEAYQVKASAAAGTIRVMTIHQAKGLGFDLVVVPFSPNARSFEKPGDPKLLADQGWVLNPPCNQALETAAGSPLSARDAARADANFAQLCVLYVSLTRAQRALYMIVPKKGETSKTVREADLLRERILTAGVGGASPSAAPKKNDNTEEDAEPGTADANSDALTELFAEGDRDWFTRPRAGAEDASPIPRASVQVNHAEEVARREPSKEHAEGRAFPAQWLFKVESGNVRAFGSAIHRLFEKIEWLEDADIPRIVADWRAESPEPESLLNEVEQQFRACLDNDEVRRQLARPTGAGRAEVWREAPFDLVLEAATRQRHLISGRFDRLVVERDATNKPVRATIFDFKSNRVETEAAFLEAADGYAGQMADYARAAARLLDLPPAQVATVLLFTRTGRVWHHELRLGQASPSTP